MREQGRAYEEPAQVIGALRPRKLCPQQCHIFHRWYLRDNWTGSGSRCALSLTPREGQNKQDKTETVPHR